MASFRKLSNRRMSLERAIQLSDEEVDADTEDQRPRRKNFGLISGDATTMENAQQDIFNKRKELMKRQRRKEIAKKYGQNI